MEFAWNRMKLLERFDWYALGGFTLVVGELFVCSVLTFSEEQIILGELWFP